MIAVANYWWTSLKLVWLVSASVGVVLSSMLLYMAWVDVRLLIKRGINSWRQYVAHTSTLIFFGGLIGQTCYLFFGIVSITRPNPPPNFHIPLISWIEVGVFIFAIWFAAVAAAIIFYRRRHIIDKIEMSIKNEVASHRKER